MVFAFLAVVILGVIIGLAIGKHQGSSEIAIQLKENERLRKENTKKEVEIWEVRRGLAKERDDFQRKINRAMVKYDSLEALSKSREARLLIEIRRLKSSTVKQLEDEAERIYRNAVDTIR